MKAYVKTEVRLGIVSLNTKDKLIMDFFYYNDGYCIFDNEQIIGILTEDTFEGSYIDGKFKVILQSDSLYFGNITIGEIEFPIPEIVRRVEAETDIPYISFPSFNTLETQTNTDICICVDFLEIEEDPYIQAEIDEEYHKRYL